MTCLLPLMYIAGINLYLILWNSIALVHLWGRHYTWCPSNACPAHVREEGQWKVQCRTRSGWTVSPGRGGSRTIGNGTTGVYRKTWHFTASLQTDQGLAEGGLYNMDWFIYIYIRWFSRCLMYIHCFPYSFSLYLQHLLLYSCTFNILLPHPALQSDFTSKMRLVRERMESREQETMGKWLTESKLKKLGQYSPQEVKSIISYCRKFPESLVRLGGMRVQ